MRDATGVTVAATQQQGIPIAFLLPDDIHELDGLELGKDAEALISEALSSGHFVIVPPTPVEINGEVRVGW